MDFTENDAVGTKELGAPLLASTTAADEETTAFEEIPNNVWVDVADALGEPLSRDKNTPSVTVRLETLSERQLTVGVLVLLLGTVLPYISLKVRRDLYDDDFARSSDACYSVVHHLNDTFPEETDDFLGGKSNAATASRSSRSLSFSSYLRGSEGELLIDEVDDDGSSVDDAVIKSFCLNEAGARIFISFGLFIIAAIWCYLVWQHWRWRPLWQSHSAVLLFFLGQLLLEDPWSAWRVRYFKEYKEIQLGGGLRGTQAYGCALLTFATFVLLDKAYGAGGRRTHDWPLFGRVCWIVVLAAGSSWPISYYATFDRHGHEKHHHGGGGDDDDAFLAAEDATRVAAAYFINSLCAALALYMTFKTWWKLRRLSYMTYRYENLILRLLLLPCVIDVVIVTLFAESFMTLYVTTLILPLLASYVHLPPNENFNPFPIMRSRRAMLQRIEDRLFRSSGISAVSLSGEAPPASAFSASASFDQSIEGSGAARNRLVYEVGAEEGRGSTAQTDDGGSVGGSNISIDGYRSSSRSSFGRRGDVSSSPLLSTVNEAVNTLGASARAASGALGDVVNDAAVGMIGMDLDIGSAARRHHEQKRPVFCLETTLWCVNLSSLVYWDPPVAGLQAAVRGRDSLQRQRYYLAVPPFPVASANGCGPIHDVDLAKLNRDGVRLVGFAHSSETSTMCHVYASTFDIARGSSGTLWVAFRGTAAVAEAEKDLDTVQTPLVSVRPTSELTPDIPDCGGDGDEEEMGQAHRGFWFAYESVRSQLHAILARELGERLTHDLPDSKNNRASASADGSGNGGGEGGLVGLVFTGHSLGGALASLAALDMSMSLREGRILARKDVNDAMFSGTLMQRRREYYDARKVHGSTTTSTTLARSEVRVGDDTTSSERGVEDSRTRSEDDSVGERGLTEKEGELPAQDARRKSVPIVERSLRSILEGRATDPTAGGGGRLAGFGVAQRVLVEQYTFGSPRVGDLRLSLQRKVWMDRGIRQHRGPDAAFRIVCEGDVVTGIPRVHCGCCSVCDVLSPRCYGGNHCGLHEYRHMGTPVFLPRKGLGDVLIAPTGVERMLYIHFPRSLVAHRLASYEKCLRQVIQHVPDLFVQQAFDGIPSFAGAAPRVQGQDGGSSGNSDGRCDDARLGSLATRRLAGGGVSPSCIPAARFDMTNLDGSMSPQSGRSKGENEGALLEQQWQRQGPCEDAALRREATVREDTSTSVSANTGRFVDIRPNPTDLEVV